MLFSRSGTEKGIKGSAEKQKWVIGLFQTTVKEALKLPIPDREYVLVVGFASEGSIKPGEYITDGKRTYEVTAIPHYNRNFVPPIDEVDICIRAGDYDINELIGKRLYKE